MIMPFGDLHLSTILVIVLLAVILSIVLQKFHLSFIVLTVIALAVTIGGVSLQPIYGFVDDFIGFVVDVFYKIYPAIEPIIEEIPDITPFANA